MKKVFVALGIFVGIILVMGGVMVVTLTANMKQIQAIPIEDTFLDSTVSQTVRGMYYFEDQIGATVDVTIVDGQITTITMIEHLCGKGEKAEVIIDDIINAQTLFVDDIAGATTSSHVIKLAIQDALEEIQ